jgi:hypothetical protein
MKHGLRLAIQCARPGSATVRNKRLRIIHTTEYHYSKP